MVDVMVVALVVVSACAIFPTLGNALLAFCMLHWGQLLDRGGVVAQYPPWHIPHPPAPWSSVILLHCLRDIWCPPCPSCSLPWQQRGKGTPVHRRAMLQKRGGASQIPMMAPNTMLWRRGVTRLIPRMTPNMMTKRMFFQSQMHLLERSRGGWLHLIQPQSLQRINSNSCRGLFHPNKPMMGRKRPRVLPLLF